MRRAAPLLVVAALGAILEVACTHDGLDLPGTPTPVPTPSGAWWNDAWSHRLPVDVTAGAALVPSSYSIAVTFDHAALVAAGIAQADGRDLRVVEEVAGAPAELDRVIDDASAWGSSASTVWFAVRNVIPAGATERVWLYHGNPAAAAPPADPARVWMFADDFESGLGRWNLLVNGAAYWNQSTAHARSGTHALHAGPISSRRVIVAAGVEATNAAFTAWWYTTATTSLDFSQVQRAAEATPLDMYKTNFYSANGWDVSKIIGNTYTQLSAPLGGPIATATWTKVTTLVLGTNERVLVDGVQVSPANGWTSLGSELARGSVGFQDANVPLGTGVWIDDVVARRYVEPEPVAVPGPDEAHP